MPVYTFAIHPVWFCPSGSVDAKAASLEAPRSHQDQRPRATSTLGCTPGSSSSTPSRPFPFPITAAIPPAYELRLFKHQGPAGP